MELLFYLKLEMLNVLVCVIPVTWDIIELLKLRVRWEKKVLSGNYTVIN